MNIYGTIILSTLLLEFLLNLIANGLNLKSLSEELPEEFVNVYNARDYRKSQEYTRTYTRFGFFSSTFGLMVILLFWFGGGFNYLDRLVRQWDLSLIWTGLVYIGILMTLRALLFLPFEIYQTFGIEERFGFNKTTPKTFVLDLLKILLLSIVIGAPLLAGVLAFFSYAGSLAWLYCWMAVIAVTLFLQFIAPNWILPLFNKFQPLEDGDLKKNILTYTKSVNYSLSGIFVMDGSKRSSKSNAFFTGFGKNKRIALYDTLIAKHTVPELVTILAHEIGHYKKKHILKGMLVSILHTGVMFYLLSVFLSNKGLFQAFYMEKMSVYAGLIFFAMLYSPIELILAIFLNMLSRKNEFEADRFALETTRKPEIFINALKKLSLTNLTNLTPHPVYVFLNYSHPPVLERIRVIRSHPIKMKSLRGVK